ncbi:MAG: hypothetical protein RL078_740 [Bacteroidota bacterium]|jgi:hypothetical protein
MPNELKLFGFHVVYDKDSTGQLVIGIYAPFKMTDEAKQRVIDKVGHYLTLEGFLDHLITK